MTRKLRRTRYTNIARQGEATGATVLRYPFLRHWYDYVRRFQSAAVRLLDCGSQPASVSDLLEESSLGAEALSLQEWLGDYQPDIPRLSLDSTDDLLQLAAAAEDLTHDDGRWKDAAAAMDEPAREAIGELQNRIHRLRQKAAESFGPEAASQALEHLRQFFMWQQKVWLIAPAPDPRLNEGLAQVAQQLRAYARPRGVVASLLARVRPTVSPTRWLTDSQQNSLRRRLYPAIERAARQRHDHERRKRQLRIVEAMLGRPGMRGILDRAWDEIDEQRVFFARIAKNAGQATEATATAEPDEIVFIEALGTVLDQRTGRTLFDLFDEQVRSAGCTPEDLAAKLANQGLSLDGRRYRPSEWAHLNAARVREAVRDAVADYLGAGDLNAPLDIESPRSAFEHVAAITPLHPELAPLLKSIIPVWVRMSGPYAEVHGLTGAEPKIHRFLYCYPAHRQRWEEHLRAHATLVGTDDDGLVEAFATAHPYVAFLYQHSLAVPLGALVSLPSWCHEANLQQMAGKSLLHDNTKYPVSLLLPERPDDYEDSCLLFETAVKASLVVSLLSSPTRYALARSSTQLDRLFAPPVREPEWQTAELFHEQLKNREIVRFLGLAFPWAANVGTVLARLALEEDSLAAASELTRLGILESGPGGRQYRLRLEQLPPSTPASLFSWKKGALRGLTRDEIMAELRGDDDLYNAVFWQVVEALELGQISANDVPSFLREYVARL